MKNASMILWLCLFLTVGAAYFLALIPVNLTGAENPEMLAIFEVDEFAQYAHVIRMVTPGETFLESARNFFVYLHYFYGFPFYALSGLTLLSAKMFLPDFPNGTRAIVCLLRMVVSVLPMILSALLLTRLVARDRKLPVQLGLFVFLLTIPAVVINDFWWHPDSLSLLPVCFVFYFLDRDAERFGWNYYAAAAATGIAVGIKYQGVYFALTVPLLLILAVRRKKLNVRAACLHGLGFVSVMILFVVIANPLLLLPQERGEIFRVQSQLFAETSVGMQTRNSASIFSGFNLNDALRRDYGDIWFWVLAAGGWVGAAFSADGRRRRMAQIVLSYAATAFAVLAWSPTNRSHYFLALALPLCCGFVFLIPDSFRLKSARREAGAILAVLAAVQFCANLVTDTNLVKTQLNRQADSAKIAFYHELGGALTDALAQTGSENRMLRVLRDAKAYFPAQPGVDVRQDWDMLTIEDVTEYRPDWILLEVENICRFGDASILDEAIDVGELTPIQSFYAAAQADAIPGYILAAENEAAALFVRETAGK